MSQAVQNLFTDISATYDRLNHVLSFNIDKSWRRKTIARIGRRPDETFQTLDLCAGTFDLSLECLRQFPEARIQAVDFSQSMLEAGRPKIKGLEGRITPVCADALHLPFADASFDVVFCGYGVRNFDDIRKGVQEMKRVLKPGGQILVLEFFRPTSPLNRAFQKTYGEHILPRLGAWVSGHKSAYTYLRDSIRGFLSLSEFKDLLQGEGFQEVQAMNFLFAISSCVSATKV